MTDYKKYALGQVENFLYDAMSSGATPQEIYDVIKGVVEDNYAVYTKSANQAKELLDLLNGNGKEHIKQYDDCMRPWGHSDMEALKYTDEELDAMCAAAAEEEELISKGYFKEDGFWKKPKDKVVKWILPIEEVDCDECIINFPDDLLEAANLKEGDEVEWIDQGDGSFKMIKVTKGGN
jgi:hypothetical protein